MWAARKGDATAERAERCMQLARGRVGAAALGACGQGGIRVSPGERGPSRTQHQAPHAEGWRHLVECTAWGQPGLQQGCGHKALRWSSGPAFPGDQEPVGVTCSHAPEPSILPGPPPFIRTPGARGNSGLISVPFPKRHWGGVSLGGWWEQ